MSDSTQLSNSRKATSGKPQKPAKPYPEFPLFPHATKRWAKKIRGKTHYFGSWNDTDAALQKYLEQKDYLHAGKRPPETFDGLLLKDLCNKFLTKKKRLVDSGENKPRTFRDYHYTCELLINHLGKSILVEDLRPDDFAKLRHELASQRGLISLGNEITRIRTIFNYALKSELILTPVRYGDEFNKPSSKSLQIERATKEKRLFSAGEIILLLENTKSPALKCMILLAINGGMGNNDCGSLPLSALDLDCQHPKIDFARVKTGVERVIYLWPETVQGLKEYLAVRPTPKNTEEDGEIVFITKYGQRWCKIYGTGSGDDSIAKEMSKILKSIGLKKQGVNFYALRHTFATEASSCRDQIAVNSIMGHKDGSVPGMYREYLDPQRLIDCVNYVRAWLFGSTGQEQEGGDDE